MDKLLITIMVILFCMVIIALPLYIAANLVFWVFHLALHLTLFQAFAVSLLLSVIHRLLFRYDEGGKK